MSTENEALAQAWQEGAEAAIAAAPIRNEGWFMPKNPYGPTRKQRMVLEALEAHREPGWGFE